MTKIPQSLVSLCKDLKCPIRTTIDQLKPRSTAYNFPLRRTADVHIGVRTNVDAGEIIRWATRNAYEVLPQGGNTSLVEGATPSGPHQNTLILSSIATDIQINTDATRLTAGAGASLQDAQIAAAKTDRWLPMTYASKGTATLGGAVATRAMGMGPGTPQLLKKVTIVDGSGRTHTIHYDMAPHAPNSVLPGHHLAWPIASQGYLGLVTETEFELFPKDNQIETLFIGGRHIPDYLILLSAIESHCDTIGYPAHFRCAELIYPQAMQAVFRHHKNPLPHSEFKFYGLAQIGTSLAESTHPLRPLILDCLSEKLSQQFTNNFEIIFANSRRDHAYFMALREYVSDAARAACKVRGETPVPFDVSCQINDLPRVLTHLDRLTQRFRQNGFGHLRQGDGTSATFHYNLGVSHTDSDRLPAIEANVLTSLYQEFGGVSHSGEHGGLGSKTLPITVQYCSPAQLDYFQTQLNTYNPHSTLQSSRIERFKELRRTTRT